MKRGYSPREFTETFPVGLTKLYELIGTGKIVARKADGKTIIEHDEGERWLKSLPAFTEHKRKSGPGRRKAAA